MKRFFTTFFLLAGVAVSLVISDSFFKKQQQQYAAKNTNVELYKSADFSEADIFDSKRNNDQVSRSN